jgi:SAM-dependent methyltransferase
MARLVQPGGTVYSNDIQPGMLSLLRKRAAEQNILNVVPILGQPNDPGLPAHQMDLILMVDVYHELAAPKRVLAHVADELKADGKLILLEFRKEDRDVPIRPEHEMTVHDVQAELAASGFELDHLVETLPWQHMFFFKRSR